MPSRGGDRTPAAYTAVSPALLSEAVADAMAATSTGGADITTVGAVQTL